MHIFEIKYARGRTVQPRAYESDRIDVELTSQLIEGEDVDAAIKVLRELTLKEVGRKPGKTTETVTAKEKVGSGGAADATETVEVQGETASEVAGEEPAAETATEAAAKPKKTRKKAAKKPVEVDRDGAEGDIQDEELVAEAAKAAGSITPQGVKDIMAEFGVPRLSVIAQEKRLEFIGKLHEAIKTRKEADAADTEANEIPL